MGLSDADLERQAQDLANKALPANLPAEVRTKKLPAVREKILERLKKQRDEQEGKLSSPSPPAGAPPPPTGAPPPPGASPLPSENEFNIVKIDGEVTVELCGDEFWFADSSVRQKLRESVVEAHREQKILVGAPVDEVARICPQHGRVLGAGAVLRMGGANHGGYGEPDIAYAYRQLARALHPDKNPDIPDAHFAFKRLSEAADELRQGLAEQRTSLEAFLAATGGQTTPEMLERPQEALIAEACRVLSAVCAIGGEGTVPDEAVGRGLGATVRTSIYRNCQPQALLNEWLERSQLLDLYASPALRTAYDCALKRHRACFLCLLNRALLVETRRYGDDCIRAGWPKLLQSFPELGLWRDFRERLSAYIWQSNPNGLADALDDDDEQPAAVAAVMDPKTKALKLLEFTWQACSGPDFQSAFRTLQKRGKMAVQTGLQQLLEQATKDATSRLGLAPGWRFQQTISLVKENDDDPIIKRKAEELAQLIGLKDARDDKDGGRSRRSRSRSRRRRRSRSRSRRRRRSRSRSRRRSRSRDRKKGEKKEEATKDEAKSEGKDQASKWDVGETGKKELCIPRYRRKWDLGPDGNRRHCSAWARKWRTMMSAILPCGLDSAMSGLDPALRKASVEIWKEVVEWAAGGEAGGCLRLFTVDTQTTRTLGDDAAAVGEPGNPRAQWAFVPMADLLLMVGDGLVGMTTEGVFGDTISGHRRLSLDEFAEKIAAKAAEKTTEATPAQIVIV